MSHVIGLIDRHFADGLRPDQRARMRDHLRGCEGCRAAYDERVEILRAAAGREPTRSELAQWGEALFARLDPAAGAGAAARAAPARGALFWAMPALACALLVLLGLVIWRAVPLRLTATPSVQLRGRTGPPAVRLADLEVFAIRPSPGGGFEAPRQVAEGDAIPLDAYLQYRYLSDDPRLGHLYVLGLDRRQQPLDYFPRPTELQSIAIRPALTPRAVPRSIRLSTRHRPGPLWIIALFSEQPLSRERVHSRARTLQLDAKSATMDLGPGVVVVIHRVLLVDQM